MAQILVVDDEIGIRELLSEILSDEGHTVLVAENATQAREARTRARPDLVLLDIWMPDTDGITLLKEWASGGQLTMPVVMMSGHATIDTAVDATRIGAVDFLEKPIALQKLLTTVKRSLAQQETRTARTMSLPGTVKSPTLAEFRKRLLQAVTPGRSALLLRGEPGTMAELHARTIHQPGTPWINAVPLLGQGSQDPVQQAVGGVLFIDDLARLSPNQQKHLAFAIAHLDRNKVKLVSFSTEGPRRLVETRGFDVALAARLAELVLPIPPVREHLEDLPEIAAMMLAQLGDTGVCPPRRFAPEALAALGAFEWPGNLEDVLSAVRTLAATAAEPDIGAGDVNAVLSQFNPAKPASAVPLDMPLREAREAFERAYFERLLAQEGGSIARVAEKSGLERTHLYRKLKALGIATGRKDADA
jgi:two-component system nitrogen regulation response regulator NtrX